VREGLHNIFASFELLNQEGLLMCTNRLIESLKKYPEVNKSFDNNKYLSSLMYIFLGQKIYMELYEKFRS